MYYILVNDDLFYVVQNNNHNVLARFKSINDAFNLVRNLCNLNIYWQSIQVPIYEHIFAGVCYHCFLCEMIIYNNRHLWLKRTNIEDNLKSKKGFVQNEPIINKEIKKPILKQTNKNKVVTKKVNELEKVSLIKDFDKENLIIKPIEKPIEKPKSKPKKRSKKSAWISLSILFSLLLAIVLSVTLWFVFTKVSVNEHNLLSSSTITFINGKLNEQKIKINENVDDLEKQKGEVPDSIDINIDIENREIIFKNSNNEIKIGEYFQNFYSKKFDIYKRVEIKIVNSESINLSETKIELKMEEETNNEKTITYNKNIKDLFVSRKEGEVEVSINEQNHEITLKPKEVGETKIYFNSPNALEEVILTVKTVAVNYEIDLPSEITLKILHGKPETKEINYNTKIKNLQLESLESDVVKVEINKDKNLVTFTSLKKGEADIVFKSDNSLNTKTVKVIVLDEGYKIDLSKQEVNLEIKNNSIAKEVLNYNSKIQNLIMVTQTDDSLDVKISEEDKTITVVALKKGIFNLEFQADNSIENEFLKVTISDNRVDINFSKNNIELDVINEEAVEETVSYNENIINLSLVEEPKDFIEVTILSHEHKIKIKAIKKGETKLTFIADNSAKSSEIKVKVNEVTILDPVIEKIEDVTLFETSDEIEFLIKVENKVNGEKLKIDIDKNEIVQATLNDETNYLKLKPLKEGQAKITVSYKGAQDVSFNVIVKAVLDISKFEDNLGYIEGLADKGSDSDLKQEDKEKILSELFKVNKFKEGDYEIYLKELEISNFHKIQGQKINRELKISAKSSSKIIKGSLPKAFLRVSPLDLADPENQIKTSGQIINSFTNEEDLKNADKVEKAILNQFISMNYDLNRISIENIKIKRGSVKDYSGGVYELYIMSTDGQNNTKGEVKYQFQGFFVNGVTKYPEISKLFN